MGFSVWWFRVAGIQWTLFKVSALGLGLQGFGFRIQRLYGVGVLRFGFRNWAVRLSGFGFLFWGVEHFQGSGRRVPHAKNPTLFAIISRRNSIMPVML